MRLADFDYELPEDAIAQEPAAERDGARLFVHEIGADRTRHLLVRDLPEVLSPGDLVVVNDTRVRAARIFARRPRVADGGGGRVELLLLEEPSREPPCARALVRPAGGIRAGERLTAERDDGLVFVPRERHAGESGGPGPEWTVEVIADERDDALAARLEAAGEPPLPPYVRRPGGADERDVERYQTVFARESGAIAAPTAGLHFTPRLLDALAARKIERAAVTLHVGLGTFKPVTADDPRDHEMHAERFRVPRETRDAHAHARARGGRVVAIGTTVVRTLESAWDGAELAATSGETRAFILPGHRFRAVDALLTNFHLPKSTLLMLVCAFAGRERVLALYDEALGRGYRFFSYGDAMLLLP